MLEWQWRSFEELDLHQLYALMVLRQEVFVVEQDCVYLDADNYDQQAHHLLGWKAGSLVACLRLFPPGLKFAEVTIGRVATKASTRGSGLGRQLMTLALEKSQQLFPGATIKLSGQAYLQAFYESFGFHVQGAGYLEDGIPHFAMVRPGVALK